MKKIISSLIMVFISMGAMAEQDVKEYNTYVKNDHHVFYCCNHGITVVVDPTVGGLFEPHITIINESGHDFVFEPQKIKVQAFAIPGVSMKSARYRVERFLEKGDTLGFEKDQLVLYTPEKYMKKTSRTIWWASLLTETIVAGIETLGGQDANTEYWNEVHREQRIENAIDERQQELARISEGYWRANTIFDQSEHEGFIAIKPIKTKYLILDIPVDGENFHFLIDNNKHN